MAPAAGEVDAADFRSGPASRYSSKKQKQKKTLLKSVLTELLGKILLSIGVQDVCLLFFLPPGIQIYTDVQKLVQLISALNSS